MAGYTSNFTGNPILICSPGRINLIGEHTDYNMGFVLPASVDKAIVLAMSKNSSGKIRLHSTDMQPSYFETELTDNYSKTGIDWADYIIGVVQELQKEGYKVEGFDCSFGGDVPIGAGLSSSAALEGGIAFGLDELFNYKLSRLEMAKISQQAENTFVGVKCGIMDQFASLHGENGKVMKLDCRSLAYEYYPFIWEDIKVLLCDTKVRRTLAGSEYNVRRNQCETGVQIIKKTNPEVESLRDVSMEMLNDHEDEMDEIVFKRCAYVINENKRVHDACNALIAHDLKAFGNLMYQSHKGLQKNYEVSCKELDILVDATKDLDGILGARMMGGGFGGCTINLVYSDTIQDCMDRIKTYYNKKTSAYPEFHVVSISKGTHKMDSNRITV
ncbi:MAG: galactokinase [Balneolaceae bacterium]|nr:galactokinase [Balneolaceae bacterium]